MKWKDKMDHNELTPEQIKRLLMVVAFPNCELYDDLWFRTWEKNTKLACYVKCNDFFAWACSDSEPISSDEDIELLQKCIDDCGDDADSLRVLDAALLYCARKRKMRPQGAYYDHLQKDNHDLFNACGPDRDIDFLNPKDQSGEYKYSESK